MAIKVKCYFKFTEEFNVFFTISLGEDVPLEDVGEDRGTKDTRFWTCGWGEVKCTRVYIQGMKYYCSMAYVFMITQLE